MESFFINELLKWNKIHNISKFKDEEDMKYQMQDSVAPLKFINDFKICIDIGSGAGIPAIFMALQNSQKKFYLLEPRKKCVSFLTFIKSELELKNVEIIPNFSFDIKELKADLIISRSVCNIDKLIKGSIHLLQNNGYYLFYKGSNYEDELREATAYIANLRVFNGDRFRKYVYFNIKEN